ncbi:MAG: response regulator transcription factor [Chloroflexi bacterium]|nr:response regulator transcription factor [Chloroflexota bacterium]
MSRVVEAGLAQARYKLVASRNGETNAHLLLSAQPDLVVLEVFRPDANSRRICQSIRRVSNVPILVLGSILDAKGVVQALRMGADNYVAGCFSARELGARVKAIARRAALPSAGSRKGRPTGAGLELSRTHCEAWVGGKKVKLTLREHRLLACLLTSGGAAVSHQTLLRETFGPEYGNDINYLRLYIRRLRRKLEEDPSHPCFILSEWGVGYRVVCAAPLGSLSSGSEDLPDPSPHPVRAYSAGSTGSGPNSRVSLPSN